MPENNGKKRKWRRVPAVLAMLLVSAELLTPAGPAGAAPESPLELADRPAAAEPARKILRNTPPPAAVPAPEPLFPEGVEPPIVEAAAPLVAAWTPVAESDPVEDTYFQDAVFLGDSRTEGFFLYSGLKEGTYFYAVGATVESVFSKKTWAVPGGKVPLLDALAETDCGKIYLMLGVNELGWPGTDIFRNQFVKLIDRIQADHPGTDLILQSLIPVSAKQNARGSYVNNDRIAAYNEVIRDLAEEKGCAFVNVAEALAGDDGCLPPNLSTDGVHLNTAGCRVWLEYLRTHSV